MSLSQAIWVGAVQILSAVFPGTSRSMSTIAAGQTAGLSRSAALEFPVGTRINVVSPTVLRESIEAYGPYFPGSEGVAGKRVALAFAKSVEGAQTGQVYYVE